MATLTSIQGQEAEYLLVQVALPSASVENAGVLLFDPANDRVYCRLRRDWDQLAGEEDYEYLDALQTDFEDKAREMGGRALLELLEDSLSNVIRLSERQAVTVHSFDSALSRLYRENVQTTVLPFRTHLPQWSARAAAGGFGQATEVEQEGWVEAPAGLRLTDDMFVAHVTGRSMLPLIPDGALCVFREFGAGSRQNKLVLVINYGEAGENRFTVKRYRSVKRQSGEGWAHERITLEPLNPEFTAWDVEEGSNVRVIGEFVRVIEEE